jgi:hypothetical protein
VIMGAWEAREARAQDRPCVEPTSASYEQDEEPPPPPRPRPRPRPRAMSYSAAYSPQYVGERPPPQRRGVPFEITASAGYAFTGSVSVPGGTMALAPSPVFGATVDIGYLLGARLELAYLLQVTGLQLQSTNGGNEPQYDVTTHHFRIGGEFDILHGRVRPFVGILLGTAWFSPQSATPDELWFEGTLEAGAKIRFTRAFGIRAQVEATGITMDARSQVFCANGCNSSWYGIATTQLALMAGPTVGF